MKRPSLLLLYIILISSVLSGEILLKNYNPLSSHYYANHISAASVHSTNDTLSNAAEIYCDYSFSITIPAHALRYYYFQTKSFKKSSSVKPEIQIYGDTDSCTIQLYSSNGTILPISLQKYSQEINCLLPEKIFSQERCFLSLSNTSTKTIQYQFILSTKLQSADFLPKAVPMPKKAIKSSKPSKQKKKVRRPNSHKKPSITPKIIQKKSTSISKSFLNTHFYRILINSNFSLSDITAKHPPSFSIHNLSPSVISVTDKNITSHHIGIAVIRIVSDHHTTSCTIKVYQKGT